MTGGGDPFYLKFWVRVTALERNCRFSIFNITLFYGRIAKIFTSFRKSGSRNTIVTSEFLDFIAGTYVPGLSKLASNLCYSNPIVIF